MNNIFPYGRVTVERKVISSSKYEYLVTFPLSMGNVPQMNVHTALLTPFGSATALVTTETDGNILSGTFRLSFEGETTGDINYDASEAEMREALEALKTIGFVEVTRSTIDNQKGYRWTIEFVDPLNDGDVETLVADTSGLEISSRNGHPLLTMLTMSNCLNLLLEMIQKCKSFTFPHHIKAPFLKSRKWYAMLLMEVSV